ncbi:MAG TPA: hypothetical protein VF950_06190 [Planctomycetota bacterium]
MRALALLLLANCGEAQLTDLDGREVRPAPTSVYVFLQPDCPIANRTAPEILRLRAAFPAAAFRIVYPGKRHAPDALRAHRDAYLPGVSALRDPDLRLTRDCRVAVTPEAAVVTAKDGLVYHGRIDDLFADFGVPRPAPTRRDLELALTALSRGEPAPAPAPGVGCPVTE